MPKILVVEDDQALSKMLVDWLKFQQHAVDQVHDGKDGLEYALDNTYDLLVLDWQLPNLSGIEICKEFRLRGGLACILFLTGKDEIPNKLAGFDAGADDYLTKPFHMREFAARVKALLRRPADLTKETLHYKDVVFETTSGCVTRNGNLVNLLPKELALLEFFMQHPQQIFSTDTLINRVWPTSSEVTSEALTSCIKRLRQKLDVDGEPSLITTVRGMGYKLGP